MKYFATIIVKRSHRDAPADFLLYRRGDGHGWRFPGGKVDTFNGESPRNCARRKFFEETGAQLEDKDIEFMGHRFLQIDGDFWLGYFFMTTKLVQPVVAEPTKHDRLGWFTKKEIFEMQLALEYEMVSLL